MFLKNVFSWVKKNTNVILFSSIFFINFISNNFFSKRFIYFVNSIMGCYIYQTMDYNTFINLFFEYKIKLKSWISYLFGIKKTKSVFLLKEALLYIDLEENHDVTKYFNIREIQYLNNKLIEDLYSYKKIYSFMTDDTRLKITFTYEEKEFILYHRYNFNQIPYPPFTKEIMSEYRHNIVSPYYTTKNSDTKLIYLLFAMSSKDIEYVKINGKENNYLKEYVEKIQTPFYDFGLLYKMPINLKWLIEENNITDFKELEISFFNMYFDEENLSLRTHVIHMKKEDLDKIIQSDIIKSVLN
jgi:hypothetical protein